MTWSHPLTHWPTNPPNYPCTHPWVGVSLQIINLHTDLNYLDKVKIYSIVSHLSWPTHWPTQPPTHPLMDGVSLQIINLQSRIEVSRLCQDLFNCWWFDLTPPIDPLTHPNHPTHPPMVGVSLQIINLQSRIEVSRLCQDLFNCWWFDLTPPHWPIDPPNHPHTHQWWECLYKS